MYKYASELKEQESLRQQRCEKKLNEVFDEMNQKEQYYERVQIELESAKASLQKSVDSQQELSQKNKLLSGLLAEMQDQRKLMEDHYDEKVAELESQVDFNFRNYQQEINSLKMQHDMKTSGAGAKEIEESSANFVTEATNDNSPKKMLSQNQVYTLQDELQGYRYSTNSFIYKESLYGSPRPSNYVEQKTPVASRATSLFVSPAHN